MDINQPDRVLLAVEAENNGCPWALWTLKWTTVDNSVWWKIIWTPMMAEHRHIWWLTFSTKRHVIESDRPCCDHELQWPVNVQSLLRATFFRVKWPESALLLAPLTIILMDTGQAALIFYWPVPFIHYSTTTTRFLILPLFRPEQKLLFCLNIMDFFILFF